MCSPSAHVRQKQVMESAMQKETDNKSNNKIPEGSKQDKVDNENGPARKNVGRGLDRGGGKGRRDGTGGGLGRGGGGISLPSGRLFRNELV